MRHFRLISSLPLLWGAAIFALSIVSVQAAAVYSPDYFPPTMQNQVSGSAAPSKPLPSALVNAAPASNAVQTARRGIVAKPIPSPTTTLRPSLSVRRINISAAGTLRISTPISTILAAGGPVTFATDSEIGRTVRATCRAGQTCYIAGAIDEKGRLLEIDSVNSR